MEFLRRRHNNAAVVWLYLLREKTSGVAKHQHEQDCAGETDPGALVVAERAFG
jgi:hypothetical protein